MTPTPIASDQKVQFVDKEFPVIGENGTITGYQTRRVQVLVPRERQPSPAPIAPLERHPAQPSPEPDWRDSVQAFKTSFESAPKIVLPFDHALPACPICGATAFHTAHAHATDLEHDCRCSVAYPERYFAALETIWRKKINLQNFLRDLPAHYRGYAFQGLEVTPANKAAISAAKALELGKFLYLHGSPGNGKTRLAVAAARRLISNRHRAKYANCATLKDQFLKAFKTRTDLPDFEAPDILILDDLDKLNPAPWIFELLFGIVDARWSNQKTTIFTAQHSAGFVAKHHALLEFEGKSTPDSANANALLSRMASGAVVEVGGTDHRLGAA
jgi:DNA replication protein DnaC